MRRLILLLVPLCAAACGGPSEAPSPATESTSAALAECTQNPNPMLYAKNARPYGVSMERWSERLWMYIYAQPFEHSPILDKTGADCAYGQEGPVWFLPAVPGSTLGTNVVRHCTIPRHKSLFLSLPSGMNDYPCPDPSFHPAPGQSLFDFLMAPVKEAMDKESGFVVTLDGKAIQEPLSYRYTSDDLFLFTGDPSLQANYDNCVTGFPQPAVADGYYLMFKPLSPGHHTIVIQGHDREGVPVTLTDELEIR